jgi:hypothetical protein
MGENIKMDLKATLCEDVDRIHLVQERIWWQFFVNTIMNLWVPLDRENFLISGHVCV